MNKEPINKTQAVWYITQYRYLDQGLWFDRLSFTDLTCAQSDLEFIRKWAKDSKMKYKYRLIRREVSTQEFEEDE